MSPVGVVALLLAGVASVVCAVATIVVVLRQPQPVLERETRKRVERALNRGRLPAEGPDRAVAVYLAQIRARHCWQVLSSATLGVSVLLFVPVMGTPVPVAVAAVIVGIFVFAALIDAYTWLTGRLALASVRQRVGTPSVNGPAARIP